MKWFILITLCIAGLVAWSLLGPDRRDSAHVVNVLGSTSVEPFAGMLAEEVNRKYPTLKVKVQGGGSAAGLLAIENNIADIGMCSRALKDDEKSRYAGIEIARDSLAIVAHPSNPLSGLTSDQIRHIFAGSVANWKDVGGPDRPIRLITREEGSGTREAFTTLMMEERRQTVTRDASGKTVTHEQTIKHMISLKALTQESNGAVKELVKHDPCAIGYMSLGLVGKELKILAVDGVVPTCQAVLEGRYVLARPFLFVIKGKPSDSAKLFIRYVLSPRGQELLEKEGLVRSCNASLPPQEGSVPTR